MLLWMCGIDFKYSIVDSGTGRELQNQPIYNIAGLGKADGDRPFRPFPKPMMFLPRSTIRIEVEELSEGPFYKDGELQIVLHGYKMLGYGTALAWKSTSRPSPRFSTGSRIEGDLWRRYPRR